AQCRRAPTSRSTIDYMQATGVAAHAQGEAIMKLQSSAISVSSFFATKTLLSRVIIGGTLALMGLQLALAETVLYGGLGGHGVASGPQASTNDGALVIVS